MSPKSWAYFLTVMQDGEPQLSVTRIYDDRPPLDVLKADIAATLQQRLPTIVVYDRIRENLRHFKQMPLPILIDDAINRTLSRTVLTSATTLIALAALAILGGEAIRTFALTLLFGVAIGTISSIYIAGPVLILFRLRPENYRPGKGGAGTVPETGANG